jgi:hypothetical protein
MSKSSFSYIVPVSYATSEQFEAEPNASPLRSDETAGGNEAGGRMHACPSENSVHTASSSRSYDASDVSPDRGTWVPLGTNTSALLSPNPAPRDVHHQSVPAPVASPAQSPHTGASSAPHVALPMYDASTEWTI